MRYENNNKKTNTWMVKKSMRDITGHSIAVAVTPNVMNYGSSLYPLLAQQNRIIDTQYAGTDNITGNVPVEIFNNPKSSFLYAFDVASIRLNINYNYLAIDSDDKNWAYNNEMAKAMSEAIANAFAETFTDLPFFKYHITTGMPGQAAGMTYLAFATFYQTVVQNVMHVINSYNTALALEDTIMQQAWLREVPQVTELYGLLKKTALKSLVQGIANYLPGAAVDTSWVTQMNILTNVPCKRSDSIEDPLISVIPVTKVPDITVKLSDNKTVVFKYSETGSDCSYLIRVNGNAYTLTDLVMSLCYALSPYAIQAWARMRFEGTTSVTARDYYNDIVDMLEGLMAMLSRFPADMADFDVVLKVLQRVNMNNWHYSVVPILGTPKYKPTFNKLLYDIVRARAAGGANMIYDENTRRWKFFTTWDAVTDIPDYDMKSGGSFLTFSLRTLPTESDTSQYYSTKWLIPHLFSLDTGAPIRVVNRKGEEFALGYTEYTYQQVLTTTVFRRLMPVPSMSEASLRVPTIQVPGSGDAAKLKASYALKLIMRMVGMGRVTEGGTSHDAVDSSFMCLVDEQIEDVSNAMINQARVTAPFRVAVAKDAKAIGFAGGM